MHSIGIITTPKQLRPPVNPSGLEKRTCRLSGCIGVHTRGLAFLRMILHHLRIPGISSLALADAILS